MANGQCIDAVKSEALILGEYANNLLVTDLFMKQCLCCMFGMNKQLFFSYCIWITNAYFAYAMENIVGDKAKILLILHQ